MDVIEITRELGKAIQADARYVAFQNARKVVDEDAQLKLYTEKMTSIQNLANEEMSKEEPSQEVMAKIQEDYQNTYDDMMKMPSVVAFEAAQKELDEMMNKVTQILYLCVSGEDPATCEPNPEMFAALQQQMMQQGMM